MDNHTATEQAYKNGYEQGYKDGGNDCKVVLKTCIVDMGFDTGKATAAVIFLINGKEYTIVEPLDTGWLIPGIVEMVSCREKVREFVKYLKEHSCFYDLDNYHSFSAIDVDYLDELAEKFLRKANDDVSCKIIGDDT